MDCFDLLDCLTCFACFVCFVCFACFELAFIFPFELESEGPVFFDVGFVVDFNPNFGAGFGFDFDLAFEDDFELYADGVILELFFELDSLDFGGLNPDRLLPPVPDSFLFVACDLLSFASTVEFNENANVTDFLFYVGDFVCIVHHNYNVT